MMLKTFIKKTTTRAASHGMQSHQNLYASTQLLLLTQQLRFFSTNPIDQQLPEATHSADQAILAATKSSEKTSQESTQYQQKGLREKKGGASGAYQPYQYRDQRLSDTANGSTHTNKSTSLFTKKTEYNDTVVES